MSYWIHQPHDSAFLGKFSQKKDRYNKNILGAIGKKESENDVVCITLQDRQFKWKKVNIPKVKEYGIDAMSIFYDNPNDRGKFFKLDTVQDMGKTTTSVTIVVILPSILFPVFCVEGGTSWKLHSIVKSWVDPKYI